MRDVEIAEVDYISMYCKTSNGGSVSIDFNIKELYADEKPDIRLDIKEDMTNGFITEKRACLSFPYSDMVLNFLDAIELGLRRGSLAEYKLSAVDGTEMVQDMVF